MPQWFAITIMTETETHFSLLEIAGESRFTVAFMPSFWPPLSRAVARISAWSLPPVARFAVGTNAWETYITLLAGGIVIWRFAPQCDGSGKFTFQIVHWKDLGFVQRKLTLYVSGMI